MPFVLYTRRRKSAVPPYEILLTTRGRVCIGRNVMHLYFSPATSSYVQLYYDYSTNRIGLRPTTSPTNAVKLQHHASGDGGVRIATMLSDCGVTLPFPAPQTFTPTQHNGLIVIGPIAQAFADPPPPADVRPESATAPGLSADAPAASLPASAPSPGLSKVLAVTRNASSSRTIYGRGA